jgi:hypothetical protein
MSKKGKSDAHASAKLKRRKNNIEKHQGTIQSADQENDAPDNCHSPK